MNQDSEAWTRSILQRVDHTELSPSAGWEQIRRLCEEALEFQTASVCIPPSFVRKAKEYTKERMPVCTVVGFPNGYQASRIKVLETKAALQDGADEIDMVIAIGRLKEGDDSYVEEEIRAVKEACGEKLLKVIVEACLLTEEEKISACKIVTKAGADFIKTSTGFAGGGATLEDVALFRKYIGKEVKIKAAGGISTFEAAGRFLELGVSRLGTSKLVRLAAGKLYGKEGLFHG